VTSLADVILLSPNRIWEIQKLEMTCLRDFVRLDLLHFEIGAN
jgi:hypothetical protein